MVNTPQTASAYPSSRRAPAVQMATQNYQSPTESEFSDVDGPDSVKNWDEDRVCEYLLSVKCGEYEKIFRRNHINGDNLLEMDKEVLKEMGIDKVGDRVRLFLSIKKLRTKTYANQKRRNRVGGKQYVWPRDDCWANRSSRIPLRGLMSNMRPPHNHHGTNQILVPVVAGCQRAIRGIRANSISQLLFPVLTTKTPQGLPLLSLPVASEAPANSSRDILNHLTQHTVNQLLRRPSSPCLRPSHHTQAV